VLDELLTNEVFAFLLVFARLGGAFLFLPGLSEGFIPAPIKLVLSLALTLLITPLVWEQLPALPVTPLESFLLIFGEIFIGVFFGLVARIMLAVLDVAGTIISFQMSLSNAFVFNPSMATQGTIIGVFLTMLGLTLVFVLGIHHVFISALINSYQVFLPGSVPPTGDMANWMARVVAQSFTIAIQISAPFLVINTVFYAGLGVLGRLMPTLQVFFLAIPLQILVGLIIFSAVILVMMEFWVERFINILNGQV